MSVDERKLEAARAALEHLSFPSVVGLGSGSTAKLFIDEVGGLVQQGKQLTGVPTSEASRAQADRLGITLLDDVGPWEIDVCVDGADEVSDQLDVIKGGGGCHTREKIINNASKKNIIIVDDSKLSRHLGDKWPVPVEVLRFGEQTTRARLDRFGRTSLRLRDGEPWITDSGNLIYDVKTGSIVDPGRLDTELRAIPGVVDTGLFVRRVDVVIVAGAGGVRILRRPRDFRSPPTA